MHSIDSYVELIKALDTPVSSDSVVKGIVFDGAKAYLDGSGSLADAVKSIAQKLDLYLAE
jgi:hypothetical protein